MRQERTVQASIFDLFADHEIGRELKAMSQWLDEHRKLIGLAAEDLRRHGVKETGRWGLPAESVLRCGLLKQHRQLSYEELAFYLEDSASFRAFARLPLSWTPKKSVLHMTISAIRFETWEAINRLLLASARQERVETGMVKSNRVYRKLRNFRAGIESDISCLKRAFGLARCVWRGLDHFRAYVWSSVVAYNLALFARLMPT